MKTHAVAALLATAGHAAPTATAETRATASPCEGATIRTVVRKPAGKAHHAGPPYTYDSKGQCRDSAGFPAQQSLCPKPKH